MSDPVVKMTVQGGLAFDRAAALGQLVFDITGQKTRTLPFLAPVLLFSDPGVQSQLPLPEARKDAITVQEFQGIEYLTAIPLDTDLVATAVARPGDRTVEFRVSLSGTDGPVAHLATALRLVPITDLGAVKATPFRPASLGDSVRWNGPIAVTQEQTDRYLTLSGDRNPLHHDPARAQMLGLPAPVVPGLLLASLIQPVVEATLPASILISLKSRFLAPLCVQAPMTIGVQLRGPVADGVQKARAYLIDATDRALAIVDLQLRVTPD